MGSSRSSGRGYRKRMNKKLKLAATPHKTTSSKPPNISSSVTRPEPRHDPPRMEPTERDLESDEAVWDLYKRWCIHFRIHRTLEEMQMRFIYFKRRVIHVFEVNEKYKNKQSSYKLALFQYSDRTDKEMKRNPKYKG